MLKNRLRLANRRQLDAIDSITEGWETEAGDFILPIVDGPPGTGKTTVGVLAAARYALENPKAQVVYLAYTNFAAEKAREDFSALGFTSEHVVRITPNSREKDWTKGVVGCNSDLTPLTPDERRRLKSASIIISTLHSSGRAFGVFKKPLIIVDEFSQVSPALYFSTLSKIRSTTTFNPAGYALLGDPNQLPVITSQPLLRPNIGSFIFSRKNYEPHRLNVQYRMTSGICTTVNALRKALNAYPLETHDSVESRTLIDLGYSYDPDGARKDYQEILNPNNPLVVVDTDGLKGEEQIGFGNSIFYPEEARLAANLARSFRRSFSKSDGTGLIATILSPYNAQIGSIQSCLKDRDVQSHCTTIYKSQGREYPCVIISFTRKNASGNIGFLNREELRAQTYVACSRAQVKLVILMSISTFIGHGYKDFEYLWDSCRYAAVVKAGAEWGEKDD